MRRSIIFNDRAHAGRMLAEALTSYAHRDDVLVLGLPRGGVPVAWEVAEKLGAPLDVLVVRKLGVPGCEELAMGAVSSGGARVMNEDVVYAMGVSRADIDKAIIKELDELRRREFSYHGHSGTTVVGGKTVILIDDGVATGATLRAAVQALRQRKPDRIIIAVPVSSTEARALLEPLVEAFVALMIPEDFRAVGQWYENFQQTTDAEVTRLLAHAAGTQPHGKGAS